MLRFRLGATRPPRQCSGWKVRHLCDDAGPNQAAGCARGGWMRLTTGMPGISSGFQVMVSVQGHFRYSTSYTVELGDCWHQALGRQARSLHAELRRFEGLRVNFALFLVSSDGFRKSRLVPILRRNHHSEVVVPDVEQAPLFLRMPALLDCSRTPMAEPR